MHEAGQLKQSEESLRISNLSPRSVSLTKQVSGL